jgi:hypothetical protein
MASATYTLHGIPVFEVPTDGSVIETERQATDVLGDARSHDAKLVILPASRLPLAFFQLRSGLAGAIVQKFVTYQMKLAIVGAIPAEALQSTALQAFIKESNRGQDVWFIDRVEDLQLQLATRQQ